MGLKKNSLYSRDIQSRLQVHTPFTPATLPAACPPPPTLSPAPRPPFALLTSAAAQVSLFPLQTSPRPVPSTDDAIEPGGQSPWLPTYGRGDGRRGARAARGRHRQGSRPLLLRVAATARQLQEGAAHGPRCAQANWGRGRGFLVICFKTLIFVFCFSLFEDLKNFF